MQMSCLSPPAIQHVFINTVLFSEQKSHNMGRKRKGMFNKLLYGCLTSTTINAILFNIKFLFNSFRDVKRDEKGKFAPIAPRLMIGCTRQDRSLNHGGYEVINSSLSLSYDH